jgi:hypothetical protein
MIEQRSRGPTLASTWESLAEGRITEELLDWPPDLFALTNVVLDRAEAFRFAISPARAHAFTACQGVHVSRARP